MGYKEIIIRFNGKLAYDNEADEKVIIENGWVEINLEREKK